MNYVKMILELLAGICGTFLTFSLLYQIVIGFWGFGKAEKDYKDHDPEMRFLVLVPAHNEEKVIGDIIGNLNHGMNRWIDWNLCVDKDGGPRHVPMGFGAPVCVNEDGTYRKLLTFDYIGHFSRYILPGAKRIAFSRCDDKVDVTAARNTDGSLAVVILNRNMAIRGFGRT